MTKLALAGASAQLICPTCGHEGEPGDGSFHKAGRQGHKCKECSNAYLRSWRKASPKAAEWDRARRADNRKLLDDYKMARGCAECGYHDHPAALDFHHLDPSQKRFNIGSLATGGHRIERLMAEIEKCSVLCANCHRILTHSERG